MLKKYFLSCLVAFFTVITASLQAMEPEKNHSLVSFDRAIELISTMNTILESQISSDESFFQSIADDIYQQLQPLYNDAETIELSIVKNIIEETLTRHGFDNYIESIHILFETEQKTESCNQHKRKLKDDSLVEKPDTKLLRTSESATKELESINIIPIKVNQQNDSFTCGDHAVCNAAAISFIAHNKSHIKHKAVNEKQAEIFKQYCPYKERQTDKYLSNHNMYDLADMLEIKNLYIFGKHKKVIEATILRGEKSHIFDVQSLDQLFAEIKKHAKNEVYHFAYNQGMHWVLFSVVVKIDHPIYIFYADSFNGDFKSDESTFCFGNNLIESILTGHNCLLKKVESSKESIIID